MGANQIPFPYDPANIQQLIVLLSADRLASHAGVDPATTIKNYEKNTILSEGLYGVLQGVEIAIRNSIHNTMSVALQRPDWYGYFQWDEPESDSLDKTKDALTKRGKPLSPGNIISELTFGFWVRLVERNYERVLWIPHLHKAFPHITTSRTGLAGRLRTIRNLRNRVAHHERVAHLDLRLKYMEMVETVRWICPVTALWLDKTNRLKQQLWRG